MRFIRNVAASTYSMLFTQIFSFLFFPLCTHGNTTAIPPLSVASCRPLSHPFYPVILRTVWVSLRLGSSVQDGWRGSEGYNQRTGVQLCPKLTAPLFVVSAPCSLGGDFDSILGEQITYERSSYLDWRPLKFTQLRWFKASSTHKTKMCAIRMIWKKWYCI